MSVVNLREAQLEPIPNVVEFLEEILGRRLKVPTAAAAYGAKAWTVRDEVVCWGFGLTVIGGTLLGSCVYALHAVAA